MCSDDEGPYMKRVVKFFLDSLHELEELDSPPLVHSRTVIVASCPCLRKIENCKNPLLLTWAFTSAAQVLRLPLNLFIPSTRSYLDLHPPAHLAAEMARQPSPSFPLTGLWHPIGSLPVDPSSSFCTTAPPRAARVCTRWDGRRRAGTHVQPSGRPNSQPSALRSGQLPHLPLCSAPATLAPHRWMLSMPFRGHWHHGWTRGKIALASCPLPPYKGPQPYRRLEPGFPLRASHHRLGNFSQILHRRCPRGEAREKREEKRKVPARGNRRPRCPCIPCSTPCHRVVLRPEVAAQHQERRTIAAVDANQKPVEGEGRRRNRSCYVRKPHWKESDAR
jgi:hypothetical protein